ncbi:MAG: GNAT family N-acetyltransferase [Proteobacteria bacterium]|nr:GNAT family N-acetyltransferase [Pseudomonadota bacterium]
MEKVKKLKDGTEVVIRPLGINDIDKSFAFFQALPPKDTAYLRVDVSKREIVSQRLKNIDRNSIRRIAAFVNGDIVADGALEMSTHGWEKHIAELRLMVASAFHRKGLGVLMAEELYMLAAEEKVEEIVVKIMQQQEAAKKIFKKLGFHEDVTLRDYAKDIAGRKQDLVLMRCNLEGMWRELEGYFREADSIDKN